LLEDWEQRERRERLAGKCGRDALSLSDDRRDVLTGYRFSSKLWLGNITEDQGGHGMAASVRHASIGLLAWILPTPLPQQVPFPTGTAGTGSVHELFGQPDPCSNPAVLVAGVRNLYQLQGDAFDLVYRASGNRHINGVGGDLAGNWYASILRTDSIDYTATIVENGVPIVEVGEFVADLDVDGAGRAIYATEYAVWRIEDGTPAKLYDLDLFRYAITGVAIDSRDNLFLTLGCNGGCSNGLLLKIPRVSLRKTRSAPDPTQVLFVGTFFMTDVDVAPNNDIYFATLDQAFKIPASGGPAQLLFTAPPLMFFEGIAADCQGGYSAVLACDDFSSPSCGGLLVHDGVVFSGAPGLSGDYNDNFSDIAVAPVPVIPSSGPRIGPQRL